MKIIFLYSEQEKYIIVFKLRQLKVRLENKLFLIQQNKIKKNLKKIKP